MALVIEIDGVDKTESIIWNSFSIKNNINNQTDECVFKVRKTTGNTYKPSLGDEVVVEEDGDNIYGGIIVRSVESAEAGGNIIYEIKCADYTQYLKRQLVIERYENETTDDIIQDLVDNYTDDSITTTNVAVTKTIASISFNGLTVAECLEKLAESLNAFWYIDEDKDIHFFQKNTELSPFNLTDTSGNYIYNSLKIEDDISQLRNSITIRGGTNPSDTNRIETIVSQDDTQDVFPLGYKFTDLPVIKVNGVAVTVGVENLTEDGTVQSQWSFQEKYIRFTAGNIPEVDDVITIEGKIQIPVIVKVQSNSSISEFGLFEYQLKDTSISTNDEAIERAVAELASYSMELNEGEFLTYNRGLRAGQVLNINSTERNKNIDVVIQSVAIKPTSPDGENFVYRVSFATLKTLGIIEYLQKSLKDEEITEDEQETLLKYLMEDESIAFVDEVVDINVTSPPYRYDDEDSRYNFATWS